MKETILNQDQIALINAAAEVIIPADEMDAGVIQFSPGHVIAMRVRYQEEIADIYLNGIKGIEDSVEIMFGHERKFVALTLVERRRVIQAIRRGAAPGGTWKKVASQKFYTTLRSDVCFIYLTDPEVCERIGFPGESTVKGGYPDFDRPQR